MELSIWIIAGLSSLIILILAFVYLAAKSVSLGKRLKPFMADVALFRKSVQQYPEAVKFLSELAQERSHKDSGAGKD
jgi:hypothetical protein